MESATQAILKDKGCSKPLTMVQRNVWNVSHHQEEALCSLKCNDYTRALTHCTLCFKLICTFDLTQLFTGIGKFYVTLWVDKTRQEAGSWALAWALVSSNTTRWCYFFHFLKIYLFDHWYFQWFDRFQNIASSGSLLGVLEAIRAWVLAHNITQRYTP